MFHKLKNTVKHTAIYSLGNLSTKLIGLILLPLYTSYLTKDAYGMLALLEITNQIIIGIFVLKLPLAMLRWAAAEKDEEKEKSIIFTTSSTLFVVALLVYFIFSPFSEEFSNLFFSSSEYASYFELMFLWSAFGVLNSLPLNLIRLREKSFLFLILTVIRFTAVLGFNIYFVAYAEMGVEGILLGQLIGSILLFLLSLPFVLRNLNLSFDTKVLKEMFKFGFPLIFSGVSTLLLQSVDRYLIPYFHTLAAVGVYSIAFKLASVINMILIKAFQVGFPPIAYKMLDEPGAKRYFSKVLTYFVFVLTWVGMALSLFAEEVFIVFTDPKFWIAYNLVPLLILGFIFKGSNYVITLGFHYVKKTGIHASIIMGGMISNVLLNLVLIPYFSYYGAALAVILSYSGMNFVSYKLVQKVYYIKYEIGKLFKLLGLGILIFSITFLIVDFNVIVKIIMKFILLLSFPFILYLLNFYEKVEIERIKGAWKKWRNPLKWKNNFK